MDEKELLKAIGKLDRDALALAFEEYAPLLLKYAFRLCRDILEADDIVGEAFSRLLTQLSEGKGPRKNLRSYLYQTVYHIIVDRARDQKHYSPFEDALDQFKEEDLPSDMVDERRSLELMYKAIQTTLTDDQKHVVVLRFLEGFDVRETAEILGKEINNIKVIQNRALNRLRDVLGKELEDF